MKNNLKNWRNLVAMAGIVLGLAMVPYSITYAQNPNSDIFPPNSEPFGKTYGEWSADWWQWALSIPQPHNPLLDNTGKDCGVGQHGPVWFLGGTFAVAQSEPGVISGTATRDCAIPADKGVLFPVINGECSTAEGNGTTEEELRSCVISLIDHVTVVEAT